MENKNLAENFVIKAIDYEESFGLPKGLLCATITVESSWDSTAKRYEKGYRWLMDAKRNKPYPISSAEAEADFPPKDFPGSKVHDKNLEYHFQKTSWGLTQVMGATARYYGYPGELDQLAGKNWEDAIALGAKHLSVFLKRYKDAQAAIAAYNAGNARLVEGKYVNQKYVDKVNLAWGKYK